MSVLLGWGSRIGKGMTSRTTPHLTAQCDDGFDRLISRRGEDLARLWYQSQAACIDRIAAIQNQLEINCAFRRLDGHLFLAPETKRDMLDAEFEATKKVGMPVERETGIPFRGEEKTPSLRYPNQATFHPLMCLSGLASAIREKGGRFYADTVVDSVEEDENGVAVKAGKHAAGRFCRRAVSMKVPHEMRAGNRYARGAEERRTLGDLIQRKTALVAICRRCNNRRLLFPVAIAERLGAGFKVIELRKRLRCGRCRGYGTANLHESSR
jgi:hypothetical protein